MRVKSLRVLIPVVCLSVASVFAQNAPTAPTAGGGEGGRGQGGRGGPGGRGSFDPAAMQERMLARIQENLGAKPEEWQVIEPRLKVLMEKQRAARELTGRGMFRGGPGGGDREQPAELTAVEKAAAGTDAAATKAALEALRAARKAREAEVTKAKDSLREVLSVGQEAKLVLLGFLD